MTAFADRTVVTIAVRRPCWGGGNTQREGWPLEAVIRGQPPGSPGPGNQEKTLEQRRCRAESGGLAGNLDRRQHMGGWEDLPPNFLQNSSFSGIQGPPLSQVS